MITLKDIISDANSWNDLYGKLCKQENRSGKLFEEFCKYYYLSEPSVCFEYKHIWFFDDVPRKIKENLNIGTVDHGIDLVLEDNESRLTVVQCKFRGDQSASISWSKDKLANLFADGEKADFLLVFTNASALDKYSLNKQSEKLKLVTLGNLLELNSNTFNKIRKLILNQKLPSISVKKPRSYQKLAIKNVKEGFKSNSRGQLILPCGAGKTLTALWVKEELKAKKTLVMLPSLALLRQIKNEWSANLGRYVPYLCVCSEGDIDSGGDHIVEHTYDIQGNVTTDPSKIKAFLKSSSEIIIYSTYQSYDKIIQAAKKINFQFDLAICDEAHKTAVSRLSTFGLIHDDSKLKILQRLYMTATPRITSENLKKNIDEEILEYICDMSNPKMFGPEFHRMSFKEAIDQKILADYKIIAIGVSDKELQKAIQQRRFTTLNTTIDEIANNFALSKFMKKYQATHAITFHSSVKKAQGFADRHHKLYSDVDTYHVNGKFSTNDRNIEMNSFQQSGCAVMTNARCLIEGIDVPAIDIVYFCDPKNSKIDIVQSAGRALRRSDKTGKEFGYIVVPIFHQCEDDLNKTIEKGPFRNLLAVIRALSDQDERLVDEIKNLKLGISSSRNPREYSLDKHGLELITMTGFDASFERKIFDQAIEKSPISWRDFVDAKKFVHALNLKSYKDWYNYRLSGLKPIDIPSSPNSAYKYQGWLSWGDWLGSNVISSHKREFLTFDEARKYVRGLNIKSHKDWMKFCASGKKPDDIPYNPNRTYESVGWIGWYDWLGYKKLNLNDKYRSFDEAKEFVRTLRLNDLNEWKKYCLSGNKPIDIPGNPHAIYKNKGWNGYRDWFGKFKTFHDAKQFVHSLGLSCQNEWKKYCLSGKLPSDIPTNPNRTYKNKGWISYGDWLGTNSIAAKNKSYRLFEDARTFVHGLKLNSRSEWQVFCKSKAKPEDIPVSPDQTYKNKGWIGWDDWLGHGKITPKLIDFRSFTVARTFVQSLKLRNHKDWLKYCASGEKPFNIPSHPERVYKNQGWISNSDWLGTKNISTHKKSFYSFEEARRFVQNLKIKNQAEWKRYSQSDEKPAEIPAAPERVYKNKGWIGLGDWLGTNRASNSNKEYLTYEMAKTFIHTLRLKDYKAWRKYCSTGNKPDYIPAFPDGVYKNKGWIGYGDWLGTNTQATFNRQYRSFKEAKKFVHTLGFKLRSDWRKYCINGNKPLDIPAAPDLKYKNEGWISWKDWFGCA